MFFHHDDDDDISISLMYVKMNVSIQYSRLRNGVNEKMGLALRWEF